MGVNSYNDPMFQAMDADGNPIEDGMFEEILTTGEAAYDVERQITRADGQRIWLSVNGAPLGDPSGNVTAVVFAFKDITERKEREAELKQYETLFEESKDVNAVIDTDGTFEHLTPSAEHVLGYDPDELTGENAFDYIRPDDREDMWEEFGRLVEEPTYSPKVEFRFQRDDGSWVVLEAHARNFLDDPAINGIVAYTREITERKEREAELKLFRSLIDHSHDGVFVIDPETAQFLDVNDTACRRLGYDRAALLERTVPDIEANLPDHEAWQAHVDDVRTEGTLTFEGKHQRADGTIVPVEVNISHVALDREYMLAVARDVTERREYERKLEESNERLEQFAYAASHDLQEPLRMVSSYLQLIEGRYADDLDEDGREFIKFAVDGADRMSDMIEGLLEYSRVDTQGEPFERIDLDEIVEDILEDLQFQITESDAEITTESLPCVEGDDSQLRQVFQNLVSNAIEYSGDDPPRIHISAEPDGEKRVISVSDEGIGIDADDTDRIFEVFQRLHSQEEHAGTGIGLALCRRIVERHGGEIGVESDPGEGTTFYFTLPLADEEQEPQSATDPPRK